MQLVVSEQPQTVQAILEAAPEQAVPAIFEALAKGGRIMDYYNRLYLEYTAHAFGVPLQEVIEVYNGYRALKYSCIDAQRRTQMEYWHLKNDRPIV